MARPMPSRNRPSPMPKTGYALLEWRAKQRRYMRARYDRLVSQGICPSCGKEPLAPGRKSGCVKCLEADQSRQRKRRMRIVTGWKGLGLCLTCGAEPMPGKKVCGRCSEINTERAMAKYQRRNKAGKCGLCGATPEPGRKNCQACRDRMAKEKREKAAKWRAAGLCQICGKARDTEKSYCSRCAERRREQNSRKAKTNTNTTTIKPVRLINHGGPTNGR